MCCFGWTVLVVWKGTVLFAGAVAVEVESCPNAKLSIKLAHSKHLLGASPLPSHAAGFAHRFSPLVVVSLCARAASVHRRTSHLTSDTALIDRLARARDVASSKATRKQDHRMALPKQADCTYRAGGG